ncbi:hypothetical protein SH580_03280 [Coraliomargarita algicola]|uniref:Glycosyl hydrolase-like 10 domain-containing protein n=1 Tax=Coraliomargarita algicola TaxID=3092156 RepID=A0ABZ0RNL5_9BACT|nr:hypothetical protein [Coraliomargarita sp. J2-16]WPJ96726.1 hypothetical protein SH580_03280 [Coraliomargarita sp. J2-16]
MERTIYFNEDNHHFYGKHPPEDMSVAGLNRLVDFYVEDTQVAGIMFCVNVQRALFPSKVWETFWGDYDPALGEDQPALKRGHGIHNHLLLRERGLDQFEIWLQRCRHHEVEGWLSMRMNDCHGLKETFLHMQNQAVDGGEAEWALHWSSEFWRQHPELRRAPYRLERSWEGAFDYGKPEVRAHHMALIKELFERYDMYGLELDWMRWGMHFAPGHEQSGMQLLNEFIREVRRLADAAEKRWGHPIKLAHRVPAHPESCFALGFDPLTWKRDGCLDLLTLSSFTGSNLYELPVPIWRAMLGDGVKIISHVGELAHACPSVSMHEYEFLCGAAANALEAGADGVYFFNQNYRETGEPDLLKHLLAHVGSLDTLELCQRRHAVTYPSINAPGGPMHNVLPVPLTVPEIGANFARMEQSISLRIFTGPKPTSAVATLILGFKGVSESALDELELRWNTQVIELCEAPDYTSISKTQGHQQHGWNNAFVDSIRFYTIPSDWIQVGSNLVECLAPAVPGDLVWAEVLFLPEVAND